MNAVALASPSVSCGCSICNWPAERRAALEADLYAGRLAYRDVRARHRAGRNDLYQHARSMGLPPRPPGRRRQADRRHDDTADGWGPTLTGRVAFRRLSRPQQPAPAEPSNPQPPATVLSPDVQRRRALDRLGADILECLRLASRACRYGRESDGETLLHHLAVVARRWVVVAAEAEAHGQPAFRLLVDGRPTLPGRAPRAKGEQDVRA